jgi:methylated-DNA-[protein]-cysteine S-methyltransferase
MTTLYTTMPSPLGNLQLTTDGTHLTGVDFAGPQRDRRLPRDWIRADDDPVLRRARDQLGEYFAGQRQRFDLKLKPHGTPFQQSVWRALLTVPFGATATYGAMAAAVGRPSAVRAAGAAIGANPIAIVLPCHRIVGFDGSLTGYSGGLHRKVKLLAHEGVATPLRR